MSQSLSITPYQTNNAAGSFGVSSDGFVQGSFMASPNQLYDLAGGVLASTETLPMWGGVGIFEDVPTPGSPATLPNEALGGPVGRATALANLTGFSVFDQAYHMVASPGNPVPLAMVNMGVHFFRLNSQARIIVAADPALASLEGGLINAQVSWDFGGQQLAPFTAAWAANVITASSWASTGGGQATYTTTSSHGLSVGSDIQISGEVPTGYNGFFKTITGTTGSTIVVAMPVNPGASTTQGTLVAGGGALAVKLLRLNIGNSMTVSYNSATGLCSWNRTGSAAMILI